MVPGVIPSQLGLVFPTVFPQNKKSNKGQAKSEVRPANPHVAVQKAAGRRGGSGIPSPRMSSPLNVPKKRARPDSFVAPERDDQACAPATPLLPTSSEQSQHELLLQLNVDTAPAKSVQLVKDRLPFQELVRTWENERDNLTICSIRLIGDSCQPGLYTAETLVTHSAWGAGRLRYKHNSDGIVPVRTSASVVDKVVKALYSGWVDIGEDVEEMLVLANALQVRLTLACSTNIQTQ